MGGGFRELVGVVWVGVDQFLDTPILCDILTV